MADAVGTDHYFFLMKMAVYSYLDKGISQEQHIHDIWYAVFFLQARVARLQVLRLFWCPRDLSLYIYICLSTLEDHHAVYTRCIGRMHSLATTSGPARKVGVVPIFKMADLEQTLLDLSSSKIR